MVRVGLGPIDSLSSSISLKSQAHAAISMPCKRGAMHSGRAALIPSRAMPAFAFILGVVPLVLATGAGEVSRPGTRVGRFWIRLIGVTTAIVSPSGTNAGVGSSRQCQSRCARAHTQVTIMKDWVNCSTVAGRLLPIGYSHDY